MAAPEATAESIPVVWLAPATDRARARDALFAWARSRGVALGQPTRARPAPVVMPWAVADEVERALAEAREALVALDGDAADRALNRAETAVRTAPELAHAPWLLAEVHRGWAARFARIEPRDPERAARSWRRAAALDGGRVAGIGEPAVPAGDGPAAARVTLVVDGDRDRDRDTLLLDLRLDGEPQAPGAVVRAEGEHHVSVVREGAIAWSGWVTFAAEATVHVRAPEPPACAFADFARVALREGERVEARGTRCARWIAATTPAGSAARAEGAPSSVRVALCAGDRCDPLARYPAPNAHDGTEGATPVARAGFPAWATWTLVGVGVAAAATGTVILATSGSRSSPTETRFVGGGVHVSGFAPSF